jgi:hypothetical protein
MVVVCLQCFLYAKGWFLIETVWQGKVVSKSALWREVAGSDTSLELLAVPRKGRPAKAAGGEYQSIQHLHVQAAIMA